MGSAQRWTLHLAALAVGIPALARSIVDTINGRNPLSAWLIALIVVLVIVAIIYIGSGLYSAAQVRTVRDQYPGTQLYPFSADSVVWNELASEHRMAWMPPLGVLQLDGDEMRVWRGTGYPQLVATIPYTSMTSVEVRRVRGGLRRRRKLVLNLKSNPHVSVALTIIHSRSLIARPAAKPAVDSLVAQLQRQTRPEIR